MISVNDLKTGLTLELDNGLWSVVEFLHVKPGKGAAFVRSKLKNVETGQVVEKTFRAGEKVSKAILDRREMQYLYKEGNDYVMMDLVFANIVLEVPASGLDSCDFFLDDLLAE